MAKAVPTVRLHGKQSWRQIEKKNGRKSKRERAKPKRKATLRRQAMKDGSLPPARKPFALFVKAIVCGMEKDGRSEWQLEMKRLGTMWHMLPLDQKQHYFDQSEAEFSKQHAVMTQMGLPLRKSKKGIKPQPATKDMRPEPSPAEDIVMIGSYTVTRASGLGDCRVLGEGSYGSVFLRMDQFQRKCAVKIFKKKNALSELSHESSLLQAVLE